MRSWRDVALGTATSAALLAGCVSPPTEVKIRLDTDAPLARALTVHATVRSGGATTGDGGTTVLVRGGALGDAVLPGDFAVVPGDGPRDGAVTLVLEASLAAGSAGEPEVRFRRTARFSFTPRVVTEVPIFLCSTVGARADLRPRPPRHETRPTRRAPSPRNSSRARET